MLAALCMEGQKEPQLDNESEIGKIPKIVFLLYSRIPDNPSSRYMLTGATLLASNSLVSVTDRYLLTKE